jgi:hypothetical protein
MGIFSVFEPFKGLIKLYVIVFAILFAIIFSPFLLILISSDTSKDFWSACAGMITVSLIGAYLFSLIVYPVVLGCLIQIPIKPQTNPKL